MLVRCREPGCRNAPGIRVVSRIILRPLQKGRSFFVTSFDASLNSNEKIVDAIIGELFNNEEKYGEKYCPCRKVTGNKEEDKKIICPCIYHLDEIEEMGHCHCNLFVKKP